VSRGGWFNAASWRDEARAVELAHLEAAARPRRLPTPPAEPRVRVVALTANWRMDGEPVEIGRAYLVPATEAGVLEFAGKARRV
jgi:hypothetical protein